MAKNRIAYALIIIITFFFTVLYNNKITFTVFYTTLFIPLLSFLVLILSRQKFILIESVSVQKIKKGEIFKYILKIQNNKKIPYLSIKVFFISNIAFVHSDPKDRLFFLLPNENKELEYRISIKYRGVYSIGIRSIFVYDLLGLFRLKQECDNQLLVTVLPQVCYMEELSVLSLNGIAGIQIKKTFHEDYAMISDLRDYIPSDGYKRIHWKMSAKKDNFISKNYLTVSKSSVIFIIDNGVSKGYSDKDEVLSIEDKITETVVSASAFFTEKKYLTKFYYMGSKEDGIKESEDFFYLYETVCNMKFNGLEEFDIFFNGLLNLQTKDFEVALIFVQQITELIFETVRNLNFSGNSLIIFHFSQKKTEKEENYIKELNKIGIKVYEK